jgi:hypothetical protein
VRAVVVICERKPLHVVEYILAHITDYTLSNHRHGNHPKPHYQCGDEQNYEHHGGYTHDMPNHTLWNEIVKHHL